MTTAMADQLTFASLRLELTIPDGNRPVVGTAGVHEFQRRLRAALGDRYEQLCDEEILKIWDDNGRLGLQVDRSISPDDRDLVDGVILDFFRIPDDL